VKLAARNDLNAICLAETAPQRLFLDDSRKENLEMQFTCVRQTLLGVLVCAMLCAGPGQHHANASVAHAAVTFWRVAVTGNDAPGCGSEDVPCKTIQYAVNRASSGDTILVAGSTSGAIYTYASSTDPCTGPTGTTGVVCVLQKHLTILGGYSTSNWSTPAPHVNRTIIDGQGAYRGVMVLGYPSSSGTSLHMEGFTIQNGRTGGIPRRGGDEAIFGFGAGLFADTAQAVNLRHMIFRQNLVVGETTNSPYGGAASGGGVAVRGVDNTILAHVTFEDNEARAGNGTVRGGSALGGGLFTFSTIVAGSYLTFTGNLVRGGNSDGGGTYGGINADALGGAARFGEYSNVTLDHVTITGNQAIGGNAPNGTGGHAWGGGVFAEVASVLISKADLRNNLALGGDGKSGGIGEGGGLLAANTNVVIDRLMAIGNTARSGNGVISKGAAGGGGAVLWREYGSTTIQVTNSIFADNVVEYGTGQASVGGGGGGLWLQGTQGDVVHCTFARNKIAGGLLGQAIILVDPNPTTINFKYTIVADHTTSGQAAVHVLNKGTVKFDYTLWANNTQNYTTWTGGALDNNHPVNDSSAYFVSPGSPQYDYRITRASKARSAAIGSVTSVDFEGESRTLFPPPDLGADEYVPIVLSVSPVATGALGLNWKTNTSLVTGVHHYNIIYSRDLGANFAQQGVSPINANTATNFLLTGLTNSKRYTFTVEARDSSNTLLDSSNIVVAIPFGNFVYLPAVIK
jgi:hypothetical protein